MAHRVIAGALLLLVTVFLAAGLTRFRFDNSYTIWFVEDDPALQAYDAFLETFGSDEVLVVAVGTEGDALSPETLQIVRDLSEALLEQEQVTRVWSLTHMEMLRNTGLGLESKRLISEVPGEPEELAEARALLDASPIYSRLVDPSGEVTAVLAVLELTEDSFTPKAELIADAREIVGDVVSGRPAWLAGAAVIDEAFVTLSMRTPSCVAAMLARAAPALPAVVGTLRCAVLCCVLL